MCPSSDPKTIPMILQLVTALNPHSILDIGPGNGRYGFLFRELLDLNWGRLSRNTWRTRIDAIEIEPEYLSLIHDYAYDKVIIGNWLDVEPLFPRYDLVFMGDVLEHFEEWKDALEKAKRCANAVLVASPNWKGSIAQGPWHGHESESHMVELSPAIVGGKCLFANSKCFIAGFGSEILERWDVLL